MDWKFSESYLICLYSLYKHSAHATDSDQVVITYNHFQTASSSFTQAFLSSDNSSDDLCVADETGNGSIVRVGVGTSKAQCCVPSIGCTAVSRTKCSNLGLGSCSSILGGLVSAADVGQLIVDAVGDDGWVKSFLLSLVDERVDGLEGGFGGGATIKSSLEFHGRGTETKVESCNGRSDESAKVSGDSICDSS